MPSRRSRQPKITQAYVDATGTLVRVDFDQAVFSDAPADGWSFEVNGIAATVAAATVAGRTVEFEVSYDFDSETQAAIYAGMAVTGTYDPEVGDLGNGNLAIAGVAAGFALGNTSAVAPPAAPELQSAVVDATGLTVTLTFDVALSAGTEAGWTVNDIAPDSGVASGTELVLTMAAAILQGADVSVDYDDTTGDAVGLVLPVAAIADFAATNNSTVTE
jgi:hypothetical protein